VADGAPSMREVSSFEEWVSFVAEADDPAAAGVGAFADEIRTRFGANKHVAVHLREEMDFEAGSCDCCTHLYTVLVIECGDDVKCLDVPFDNYGNTHELYLSWLDEPRRQAEQAAATKARREAAEAQIDGLVGALEAVDPEGVLSEDEWAEAFDARFGGGS
jgi:hypothetical protein